MIDALAVPGNLRLFEPCGIAVDDVCLGYGWFSHHIYIAATVGVETYRLDAEVGLIVKHISPRTVCIGERDVATFCCELEGGVQLGEGHQLVGPDDEVAVWSAAAYRHCTCDCKRTKGITS